MVEKKSGAEEKREKLRKDAVSYHKYPKPGKLAIAASKPLANQYDLSLAYSPGVAFACEEIVSDPLKAAELTSRGNLVAVVTNGTAVLGMGNIGPLASKPVMEGKAVLFKKFGGLDCFDIEVNERDREKFCDIVAALEPTFGGINLEDIKAPECFYIEKTLKSRMKIPVFHDDQHGTAIIVAAGARNAFYLVGKKIEEAKIVCSGAGAAGLSCLDMLVAIGARKENILLFDRSGLVRKGEAVESEPRFSYARDLGPMELGEACEGADMFLGCSARGVLKPEMVKGMAKDPIIFALANPDPEILPEEAKGVREDVIIATGRSDYANQVNNVLCFPFVFRGALDVGATEINEEMKKACAESLASLARKGGGDGVDESREEGEVFGREHLIPKPFDRRLIFEVAPAVARAAMESGVATRKIEDMESYKESLKSFVYRSGSVMKPLFEKGSSNPCDFVYAEGEHVTVLRSLSAVLDQGLVRPVLVGRPDVVKVRMERLGLEDLWSKVQICDPEDDPRYREYYQLYYELMKRKGVSLELAKMYVRTKDRLIAMLMLKRGEVGGGICGVQGEMGETLQMVEDVLGKKPGVKSLACMVMLLLPSGTYFIADTHAVEDPDEDQMFETVKLACKSVECFGIEPVVGMMSHSNFGSRKDASALKVSRVTERLHRECPELLVEGELNPDFALFPGLREKVFPDMSITGRGVNVMMMPTIEAANISYNALKSLGSGTPVGPMLLGASLPIAVVTTSTSVRNLVNMTAVVVNEAYELKRERG